MPARFNKLLITIVVCCLTASSTGCVYYNTFYNSRTAFNEAEKTRKASRLRGGRINTGLYETAIEKAIKVAENYPNSKWYDDALFVLGVSYYYTEKYISAENRLRELLANYPESKFAGEAELYLAKTKLEVPDQESAMEIFQKIFQSDYPREHKAEAAVALGDYYFKNKNYDDALPYFRAVRDSLGKKDSRKDAQRMIADTHFNAFKFREALGAYLQMQGMDPDSDEKYYSLFQSALCCFSLMKIEEGLDYLGTLAKDEAYFDSLSVIKLRIAEGYEYAEDVSGAEEIYRQVLEEEKKRDLAGRAAYHLGLIYQFDYDDLPRAKDYYDQTVNLSRSSDYGKDALERSSDIGKIKTFARPADPDSISGQEMVNQAAATQYQLAGLYWFNLNKPDSAFHEMKYIVDSFPRSSVAPKALIALSQMYLELYGDSAAARQTLEQVQLHHPRSDYVPEALEALGLLGTEADTGYAEIYLRRAEDFLVEQKNVDSARYYYEYILLNFPRSKYYIRAEFSLIWLEEEYNPPGDSSLIEAYTRFTYSYPDTEWSKLAENRLAGERLEPQVAVTRADSVRNKARNASLDALLAETVELGEDTTLSQDRLTAVYIGPNGEKLTNVPMEPTEVREDFVYPVEAYRFGWEGDLYFQIFLDFSGEVVDYMLKIRSEVEEINQEASKAVASMIFDPLRIRQEQQDTWMVYKFEVRKPDHLR